MPASSKKTASRSRAQVHCPNPQGILIPIGGHERKEQLTQAETGNNPDQAPELILQRVVDELQGKGPIVVIPTAAEEAEEAGEEYVEIFRKLGAAQVEVLNVQSREQANDESLLKQLQQASGIMFTGGDQLRLTALLGGTLLQRIIKERYTNDRFVVAGTSAGATAMSTPMIYQGRNDAGMLKD
ncbi:cyanophycinase [Hymenobacter wooponensis]|uniref:cyanophycinase n=1 Tax=Hymenobacter wooponensis TaxID=1525360 RepID=UPI001FD87EF4|nr:Type 1 glutamine amidotransferase-like domain-containing protein [Hymenobacter wooponensis]